MSGIYIKDMSKPKNCHECPFLYVTSICDGSKDCPLIPVPDHGRRVVYRGDVYNAIEEKRIKTLDRVLNDRYIDGMHDGLKQALFALATVEDAPTIIPAEEVER